MSNAKALFAELKVFLAGEIEGADSTKLDQLRARLDQYRDALVLFDGVFTRLCVTPEEISGDSMWEEHCKTTKLFIEKAIASWRALALLMSPKAHCMEDHCLSKLEDLKGLGGYDEEFVERGHQLGVRFQSRGRAIRDPVKRYLYFARWEHANRNPLVHQAISEVNRKRARKRKRDLGAEQERSRKETRENRRNETANVYEAPREPLPSASALNKAEIKEGLA